MAENTFNVRNVFDVENFLHNGIHIRLDKVTKRIYLILSKAIFVSVLEDSRVVVHFMSLIDIVGNDNVKRQRQVGYKVFL